MSIPQPIGYLSPSEEADAIDQLFGPSPCKSDNRKPIAADVSNEVRSGGGDVIDVRTSTTGILIVGSVRNTVCQLLLSHSGKPAHSLPTGIYTVKTLHELRAYLRSI
jgi:hypothetical protein